MKTFLGHPAFWLLHASLITFHLSVRAATNDLTTTLQRGLFEEEANHNLEAAAQAYQAVSARFDQDRKLAATAIFRLGEVYRKQGKTNEATAQYERIVREFSDQQTLVTLSRQNLVGLGASNEPPIAPTLTRTARLEQKRLIEEEIKLVEQDLAEVRRQIEAGIVPQSTVRAKERELLKLRQQVAALDVDAGAVSASAANAAVVTDEEEKEIRRIQAMIQNSPDLINAASGEPRLTPLVAAATKGQTRVASFLLDHGADVNLPSTASTPLGAAVANGHKAMAELLLSRGADLNGKCYRDQTALHIAAEKGFRAVAEVLLANKAQLEARTDKGYTPLHLAVQRGVNSLVQFLASKGANANAEDNDGVTVLSHALTSNKPEFLKTLLAAKADPNAGKANLPLLVALRYGDLATLEELLRSGADANKEGRVKWEVNTGGSIYQGGTTVTPLWLAVSANKPEAVKLLLKHKADPNGKNPSGKPILLDALANTNVLSALLEAGASPDANDGQGGCALLTTVWAGNPAAVEMLLAHGAKVNVRSADGRAPLDYAVEREDEKSVELLLAAKAEVNAMTAAGFSALHLAVNQGSKGIVELLLANGADVNLKNKEGETPLHWAVRGGNRGIPSQEMVGLLLANGADPNIRNDQGLTPLDLAKSENVAPGVGFGGFGSRPGMGLPRPPVPSGTPGVPTRALRQPAGPQTTGKPESASVAELLRQHGARDDLPKLDRIEVRRPSANYSATVFWKGTNDWNQFTVLELIAVEYGLLSTYSGGKGAPMQVRSEGQFLNPWGVVNERQRRNPLPFPDFGRVIIRRPTADGRAREAMAVDVAAMLQSGDCSKNITLNWGDVVEIAEADHPINEQWPGFSIEELTTINKCLKRTIAISVKDQTVPQSLALSFSVAEGRLHSLASNQQFALLPVLNESKLLRASSDLSRVRVTRHDPTAGQTREWLLDCSNSQSPPDLWLRDGDAIEVPDKP